MHPLKIDDQGIHVFPHVPETSPQNRPGTRTFPFYLQGLDDMLSGGVENGTTTLLTGPSGVGKSTLATLFLCNTLIKGSGKAVYYSFEESRNSLRIRSANLGLPIDKLLDNEQLKICHINPNECYPDEFMERVRRDVEEENRQFVAIDSLKGYELAMQEFGKPIPHLHHLISYLKNQDVTSLLTNESQTLSGSMRPNELVMSHLADNILVMRYADLQGEILKVVGCMKKRLNNFLSELRELRMRNTPEGITVGPPLKSLHGILATNMGSSGPCDE